MKRAVGYVRVSTTGQAEQGYGLSEQKDLITAYADDNDFLITRWVEDEISGTSDAADRLGLSELLYGDTEDEQAVIVAKTDRVSRDVNIYYGIRYLLFHRGLTLLSAEQDYSEFGAFGAVIETFMATLAELERGKIVQRTSGGRRQKAKSGGYSGGKAPYGYRAERGRGQLMINESEAKVVRTIFQRRGDGLSISKITSSLREDGVISRSGGAINYSTVRSVLKNKKVYQGLYRYGVNGQWVVGQHKAII